MNYNKRNILWALIFVLMSSVTLYARSPGEFYKSWITQGDLERVQELIENHPFYLNRFDFIGTTPLQFAIDNQQYDIAHSLINHGANATEAQRSQVNSNLEIR
jgi:ankyrin repeat protein